MGGNQTRDSVDIDQNLEEILEAGRDTCIYKVPHFISRHSEEIYTPRLISIGPLHYGNAKLMGMEKQKTRLMSSFRGRLDAHVFEEFETYIRDQEQLILNHYSVIPKLPIKKFATVILRDAVFVVELLLRYVTGGPSEFLLENVQLKNKIVTDLLLIENQIPFFVVNHLFELVSPSSEGHPPCLHVCHYFFTLLRLGNTPLIPPVQQIKHFTDLMRYRLVPVAQSTEGTSPPSIEHHLLDLPKATKLYASGLEFKVEERYWSQITLGKRKSGKCLPWLEVLELQIPRINITPETEYVIRNIMAFELFHYPTETNLCHFVNMMDRLIDTTEDVDLLVEKGIIVNHLGDAESLVKMFNGICKDMVLSRSPYDEVIKQMNAHCRQPWSRWKVTLKRTYFSDIWTGTATFAAVFLLILTIVQAVCSILQVK